MRDPLDPEATADLLPYGFIWTPSCPDLNQSIFETRYTLTKLWQICFHVASFGHLSVQIWIKPFSKPDTPPQSYGIFASIWLHSDTFLSRSGSCHFRTRIHFPKAMADLRQYGFIWTPFCADLDQSIFEDRYTPPKLWQICFHMASFGHLLVQI